ncbi:hypothetical protein F2P79_002440 [Pimephales promelas]|nr:hypothetical protein F2P79_002440 [Pimephales promelas]
MAPHARAGGGASQTPPIAGHWKRLSSSPAALYGVSDPRKAAARVCLHPLTSFPAATYSERTRTKALSVPSLK